jgi:hypothetical protein
MEDARFVRFLSIDPHGYAAGLNGSECRMRVVVSAHR